MRKGGLGVWHPRRACEKDCKTGHGKDAMTCIRHWSGQRDSNPRMSAWEADALPLGDARVLLSIARTVKEGKVPICPLSHLPFAAFGNQSFAKLQTHRRQTLVLDSRHGPAAVPWRLHGRVVAQPANALRCSFVFFIRI